MATRLPSNTYNNLKLLSTFIKTSIDEIFDSLNLTKQDLISHNILQAVKLHYEYVDNLAKYLSDELDWDPPSYTRCEFGKIYYSLDPNYINSKYGDRAYDIFRRIEDAHIEFHKIGEDIIDAYKTGDTEKINRLILELSSKSRILIQMCKAFVSLLENPES